MQTNPTELTEGYCREPMGFRSKGMLNIKWMPREALSSGRMKDPSTILAGEIPGDGGESPWVRSAFPVGPCFLLGPSGGESRRNNTPPDRDFRPPGRAGQLSGRCLGNSWSRLVVLQELPRRPPGDQKEASGRALGEEPRRSADSDWPKGHAPPHPSPPANRRRACCAHAQDLKVPSVSAVGES
ncbi:hypothetical protein J1605_016120 [Eschrichtius robustus]|uniref:Uncharacterized protein n=1 Tax=Eschrichtius robustus TaxID=9764 RepID=A0AB34GA68_ESCRO|nr:hypothetical protein J1605_016120 [Eschrichtius robustus]